MNPTERLEASHMPVASLSRAAPGATIGRLEYPYAPAVTDVIRRIPGREFNRTYKVWLFPLTPTNILQLRDGLKETIGYFRKLAAT